MFEIAGNDMHTVQQSMHAVEMSLMKQLSVDTDGYHSDNNDGHYTLSRNSSISKDNNNKRSNSLRVSVNINNNNNNNNNNNANNNNIINSNNLPPLTQDSPNIQNMTSIYENDNEDEDSGFGDDEWEFEQNETLKSQFADITLAPDEIRELLLAHMDEEIGSPDTIGAANTSAGLNVRGKTTHVFSDDEDEDEEEAVIKKSNEQKEEEKEVTTDANDDEFDDDRGYSDDVVIVRRRSSHVKV